MCVHLFPDNSCLCGAWRRSGPIWPTIRRVRGRHPACVRRRGGGPRGRLHRQPGRHGRDAGRQAGGRMERLAPHRGHRTPAEWLAGQTKSTVGQAIGVLDTAAKLDECPGVEAKARAGQLSVPQTQALARAVSVDPSAELALLAVAKATAWPSSPTAAGPSAPATDAELRDTSASTANDRSGTGPTRTAPSAWPRSSPLTPGPSCSAPWPHTGGPPDQARTDGATNRTKPTRPTAWWPWPRRPRPARPRVGAHASPPSWSWSMPRPCGAVTSSRVRPADPRRRPGADLGAAPARRRRRLARPGHRWRRHPGLHLPHPAHPHVDAGGAAGPRPPNASCPGATPARGPEIDHLVPVEDGGHTAYDNLARLCHHPPEVERRRGGSLTGGPGAWSFTPPDHPPDG